MKRVLFILISISILAVSAIGYSDYRIFTMKKELYSESLKVEELITKYETILNEADKMIAKVDILKRKDIDDSEFKAIIQRSEVFLTQTEVFKAKHIEQTNKFNQISERYNRLSNQKLLFKNRLPEKIKKNIQHLYGRGSQEKIIPP